MNENLDPYPWGLHYHGEFGSVRRKRDINFQNKGPNKAVLNIVSTVIDQSKRLCGGREPGTDKGRLGPFSSNFDNDDDLYINLREFIVVDPTQLRVPQNRPFQRVEGFLSWGFSCSPQH